VDLGALLEKRGELKKAHQVYQAGLKAFPDHPLGKLCRNEILRLESKTLNMTTHNAWTPAGEQIKVTHRNVDRVWFRLYSVSFKPGKATLSQDPLPDRRKWLPAMLKGKPVRAWDEALVDQGDFKGRSVSLESPEDLPDGYHVLIASADEDFALEDNALSVMGIHITPLALLATDHPDGGVDGYVVDAVSGDPLEGIKVEAWTERDDQISSQKVTTNKEGYYRFKKRNQGPQLVIARRGFQRAVSRFWGGGGRMNQENDRSGVVFFTDRAIYRPGQTVHFKGIWYS
jgi:hypothetical protein